MARDGRPRVLVAASSVAARARLAAIVATGPVVVLEPSAAARSLREQIEETRPDVLIVAGSQRDVSRFLRELARPPRAPAVVVLTDDTRRAWRTIALRGAVQGVLPQDARASEIVAAVDAAVAGLVVLHPTAISSRVVRPVAGGAPSGSAHTTLTPRETEILGMLAEGLGNKTIAARLGISGHTVKFHLASIFTKLDAGSRTAAVTLGLRYGLIMV